MDGTKPPRPNIWRYQPRTYELHSQGCAPRRRTVIGVVPSLVEKGGRMSDYIDVHYPTDNLSDRKDLMINQCDIVVALPGGVGSLDEIFSVAASNSIGYHSKKVILYNMKGFWNALIALMDDLDSKGMIRGNWHNMIEVANNIDELTQLIQQES